jgi:glucose-6-phosphate 1-dehydrogenase
VKVMQCLRAFPEEEYHAYAVRGQYGLGYINEALVPGYREEENVARDSSVETYIALELHIDNWRWAGVPFYLRAGKRLPKRATEIAIVFKNAPGFLFQAQNSVIDENILVIRIQPDEGISLKMNCKVPGLVNIIQPVKMDFRYTSYFGGIPPEAYERLIYDSMSGDSTLFARVDEVLSSWKLLNPLIKHWEKAPAEHFPNYQAGTWGPEEGDALLERSGRQWRRL